MPKIIYGTAWKKDKTKELVLKALELGYRGIDTACQKRHYNELGVGDAVKTFIQSHEGMKREDLFIQTKFTSIGGHDLKDLPYNLNSSFEDQVFQSFSKSKENLGVTFVDSYVLHSPMRDLKETLSVWSAMEHLVTKGEVKQLGISNCYDLDYLKALCSSVKIKPSIVQNRFYGDTNFDGSLRSWLKTQGIYYQSFWTLTGNRFLLESKELINITKEVHGKTPEQILLRYVMDLDIVPLTGTKSEKHMKDDLEILNMKLSQSHIESINKFISKYY